MHAPVIQPCGAARSPLAVGGPRSRVVATDFAVGGPRSRDPDVGGSVDVRNAPGAGQVLHPTNEVECARSRVVATDFAVGGQRSRVVATDFAVGGQRSRDPDVGGSVDVRNARGAGQVLHPTNEVECDRAHPTNEVHRDRAHPANERQLRAP